MSYPTNEYREGKRLHPLTLLYRAISNSPSIIIPVYLATTTGSTEEWLYIVITFIVLFVTLPNIILFYFYFSFYITPKEIVIRSGILSRKQRNIPIKKVQNVNIEQNVLMRLLGLSKVVIETAGDVKSEGVLEFVSKADAEEIKTIIKSYQYEIEKEEIKDSDSSDTIPEENETDAEVIPDDSFEDNVLQEENVQEQKEKVLFTTTLRDAVYYGSMRLRPVVLMIAFWLMSVSFQFDIMPDISELGVEQFIEEIFSLNPFFVALYVMLFVFLLIVVTIILDIILTINQYYNFRLTKEDNKLYTSFGLLTKRNGTIPLRKLQSLTIITNPIKKKFDYYTLALQTAGFGEKGSGAEAAVPFGKLHRLMGVVQNIYDFTFPDELKSVSKLTIRRAFIRYLFGVLFLATVFQLLVSFTEFSFWNYLWVLLFLPLILYAAILRYRYRGYAISDDKVIIKQGFWIQKTTVVQIKKIQTLNIKETFFQRRLGLASLYIDTASSSVIGDAKIVDIEKNDAIELMEELSYKFKYVNK
jgi:putative membrane protein